MIYVLKLIYSSYQLIRQRASSKFILICILQKDIQTCEDSMAPRLD